MGQQSSWGQILELLENQNKTFLNFPNKYTYLQMVASIRKL
jgi:hypothetical protein